MNLCTKPSFENMICYTKPSLTKKIKKIKKNRKG